MKDENDLYRNNGLPEDPISDTDPMDDSSDNTENGDSFSKQFSRFGVLTESMIDPLNPPAPRLQLLENDGSPFLPRGVVGLLCAEGGIGKSQFFVQLACDLASGDKFLDTFNIVAPGRVALLMGEEPPEEVHRRIFYSLEHQGYHSSNRKASFPVSNLWQGGFSGCDIALISSNNRFYDPPEMSGWAKALKDKLSQEGEWAAILLDPLSRWGGPGIEKDNYAATKFMEVCETFCSLPGNPTVLLGTVSKPS